MRICAPSLDLARRHGLWIVADEIYGRFVHDPALTIDGRTPSFRDVMEPEDRILFVQTFSKNWAMTGWRLGWLEASPALGQVIENLVQYQTSGTPVFVQRAGVAAIEQGEDFLADQIAKAAPRPGTSSGGLRRPVSSSCRRRAAPSTPS